MPHLFVDISSHGYGHLAQTAPVLERLTALLPTLRLTIKSALPAALLRQRLSMPFSHLAAASDFGFVMTDALTIDRAATQARYRQLHADYAARVAAEAERLRALGITAVLSNVAYLPLAAAAAAGLPAVALCSLHWAALYAHYFGPDAVHAAMLAAYRQALFLRPTPAMPLHDLTHVVDIGPLATRGRARRQELATKIGANVASRLILVALGGIPVRLPAERWPPLPATHWLVPQAWRIQRRDMHAFEPLGLPFVDLLASVDAVLTKPGYGTFSEAVANGCAVLYVRRQDDWPEQDCLIEWLERHARCTEIPAEALASGAFGPWLDRCLARAVPPAPTFDGAETAARVLADLLR